jgi:serine/threonine-protein kinase
VALAPGTRFGAYDVLAALGAGGMGEVYRARDGRLNRDVALKILPAPFALDPDRLARFKREAQVLASLNHPNIAAIHGVEEVDGVQGLILELVDGATLAERIERGPIPLDDALPIARQIAEALEAAHEQGIIHRDLKPANISVRPDGTVKVLDFGLAKALEPAEALRADIAASPTITSPALTQMGMILGTAAYLSPEQIKGRPADKRSDVWAFGVVLYELLSGRRAFSGDDVSDTLAAVLRQDVDLAMLPPATPPAVRHLVSRCLDRDVRHRLRDIGEARIALDDHLRSRGVDRGSSLPHPVPPLWRRTLSIAIAIGVTAAASAAAAWYFTRQSAPAASPITRFVLPLPDGQAFVAATPRSVIALSPDGTRLVYAANTSLYLRPLSGFDAQPIQGTAHEQSVTDPVFSPDGASVLFYASENASIARVPVSGGRVVTICKADPLFGISWGPDGIVFGQGRKGIMRVAADGKGLTQIAAVKDGEEAYGPQILPGGRHLLYTVAAGNSPDKWDQSHIVVQPLDGGAPRKTIIDTGTDGRYLATGHLVYGLDGALFAVPFDLERLEATGTPTPVVDDVRWSGGRSTGAYHYAISKAGSLIYIPAVPGSSPRQTYDLVRTDRQGRLERFNVPPLRYASPPRVSPDGKRVAFGTDDGKQAVIYTYELSGASPMQREALDGNNRFVMWSSDGWLVYQSDREGDAGIWRSPRGGTPERLTRAGAGETHVPESWNAKANVLLFSITKGTEVSLWTIAAPWKDPHPFGDVRSIYPTGARFSPDGQWVAYTVREPSAAGTVIHVRSFPATTARYQLPAKGPNFTPHKPAWSPDGSELFYVPRIGEFEVVPIASRPAAFAFGNPAVVPRPFAPGAPNLPTLYDVAPDGRFIGLVQQGQSESFTRQPSRIRVVLNWFDELEAAVPGAHR